ncbi:DUF1707 domain-containing protein [Modestobacter marinus]|uniref:DUF1707 domain-containing protein n=1 Tax=Modestobacter marinus TaxID=477641 RepID=A0A846LJN4_9ACTN|nr:DUF1707 domain-containing protein [Modestobacter marinus]NIH66784.1 hypothetical protein [Modestobacter marinus]GGL49125.1 hypothetical protein GCM10011589_02010 [Modestobacter marinus]
MPEPHLRAADSDRTAVAEVLGRHMSAGRLTVAEYDERLARAYAARTYGELAELTSDLPTAEPVGSHSTATPAVAGPPAGPAGGGAWAAHGWYGSFGPWAGGASMRAAWASWLSTAVIVVGIWLITSLASDGWLYPWPIWVIGPWGLVLLAQTAGARRGTDRQPQLPHGAGN